MFVSDFDFELPEPLVAQYPAAQRTASRLLCLDGASGRLEDAHFENFPGLLAPGDLLVFNDTQVIPARLDGRKATGGRVEILVERVVDEHRILAHLKASKPTRAGARISLDGGSEAQVLGRHEDLFELRLSDPVEDVLARVGRVPLPPYIRRPAEPEDVERYQTVYASRAGAVAAPTAGLHFDRHMLDVLESAGVELAFVTLHIGAGTFQPMRSERIEDHRMHAEYAEVSEEVCRRIARTRARGGRVVAVGTTTVRSLETASGSGAPAPFRGFTRLFIHPGFRFRCVDAMVTNFHLPGSSLLLLVGAFVGREPLLRAYRHGIAEAYRFYSYGDAMFLTRGGER